MVEYFKVPFTIKSGGHAPYPFWSSCEEGILFSLEKLNQITLGPSNELVKIGAGCRWRQIYESLASHNLTVTGGRYGDVGCGGLLTGCEFSCIDDRGFRELIVSPSWNFAPFGFCRLFRR